MKRSNCLLSTFTTPSPKYPYDMTMTNGNGDANSVHPTKDQPVDITKGQTAVELAVAGGPADANGETTVI
jgi:hypothetical protein